MAHACDVVIATRNRPEPLARCLRSLRDQTEQDFGVVVVDDHSDRPLDEVVTDPSLSDLDITLRRLPAPSGPAAARNAGVEECSAEFVIFLDDDVRAHHCLIETHLASVRAPAPDGGPVVSCGPFVEPADWDPTPWNKWEAVQARKEADNLTQGVYEVTWRQFHTGNNCLPSAVFRAVGGFDADFKRAEDDELAQRLAAYGCTFRFEPEAIVWHYAHRTLESWLAIPRAYAVHDHLLDRLHPDAGYLETKKAELTERHPLLRASRRLFVRQGWAEAGVKGFVTIGSLLYRLGLTQASMRALSAAYDLSYVDALQEAEQRPPDTPRHSAAKAG